LDILEGTFETHHGICLDKGTSLFNALGQISAEEASIPVGNGCATVAAQVEHVEDGSVGYPVMANHDQYRGIRAFHQSSAKDSRYKEIVQCFF